jgi:hypothetical protein
MTRRTLFSGLVSVPFGALVGAAAAKADAKDERLVVFGPGKYSIAPGGGIRITGASDVHIEGCTLENCVIE